MGMTSIVEYLENKTLFITGCTGFLGKIFIEKVLRAQPKVKRLFLLVRPSPEKSIQQRFHDEVIGKDLFDVLRESHGDGFGSFVSEKVHLVAGDVADEDLGIVDDSLMSLLLGETDVVVNIAATTRFDERYDVALSINTFGTKHVMEFSNKCSKIGMLLHVSTAYVAGEKSGVISEEPLEMGEALSGRPGLDVDAEVKLAAARLKELQLDGASKAEERIAMKKLGIQRARHFGWPNTYVFTKSMGEMIVGQHKGDLPVAIMRPTIITSTLKEPFPGWVEGSRTIDSFIVAYAKGNLSFILGDPALTMDVIPGDMVVNAMLGIVASAHPDRPSDLVYHVGSSSRNPVNYALLSETTYRHMRLIKGGKGVRRAKFFTTKDKFVFHMKLSYKFPLEVLRVVDKAFFNVFRDKYVRLNKKYKHMMRLADLYEPYTFFKGTFDDENVGKVLSAMADRDCCAREKATFDFDSRNVDWEDYFMNVHVPGVLKYLG